jgi:hypothetical protein
MLLPSQVALADVLLVEFIADYGLPLSMADRKSWHRLVDQMRPGVSTQLTRRTKAKEKILKDIAGDAVRDADEAIKDAKDKGHQAGLITDGWTNVSRVGIDGFFLTLLPSPYYKLLLGASN